MKSCASWADAITDYALGGTPEPDLAAHLAICQECQKALQVSRSMAERLNEALHRNAAAEPPVRGPERVMARIDGQSKGQSKGRAWWPAVLAISVAMIAVVMWVRRPPPRADVTAVSTWRSPTEALLRPPIAAAWTIRPRLGDGFFKIKPLGEIHAQ